MVENAGGEKTGENVRGGGGGGGVMQFYNFLSLYPMMVPWFSS